MLAQYTTEQRVNIVKSYYRTNSVTSTARKFATENECAKPSRNTIHRLINKFEATGSVLDESRSGRPSTATTEQNLERIHQSLARSPQKSAHRLSVELGVSYSSVWRLLKEAKLHPFRPRLIEGAWLDDHFPDRWIGRRGAIEWPPRSPDLTPPDFFLWGVLKDLVYSEKPRTIAALKDVICNKIAMIELDLCRKVCRSVPSRLQKCIEAQGAPTELF